MIEPDGLTRRNANFTPLTPLSLLARTADVHPDRIAVRYRDRSWTYREFRGRCLRLGAALVRSGIGRGDVVSVLAPNTPAHLEAHFGVPMAGAVLNAINIRVEPATVAYMLRHAGSKMLIVDEEFAPLARQAMALLETPIKVVHVADEAVASDPFGEIEYETFIAPPVDDFTVRMPQDEWESISLNYTSGTTSDPKGVLYHHRGAYLNALGNVLAWGMSESPVYLWTLPMFHCNGWCFPWTIAALGGTAVCLRKVDAATMVTAIMRDGVTHMCGAPVVLAMLANAPADQKCVIPVGIKVMAAGAPPPPAVIGAMEKMGFVVTHTYGMTETYGPCVICEPRPEWADLPPDERAALKARQGVRYHLQESVDVISPQTLTPVPADGETMGEVVFRGNIVMKGYLKAPEATEAAFADGWMRSGDLGVIHPDGYIQIKDRLKDIIISGGENISTIEVESVLFRHPSVLEAAVVAQPDPRWGEVPCAVVVVRPGHALAAEDLIAFTRLHLAGFKVPKNVLFAELPKTATGKVQKFMLRDMVRSMTAEVACND